MLKANEMKVLKAIVGKTNIVRIRSHKKDINSKDIVNKISKGKQIIGCLNSLWWDKNISLDTKKRLGKAMV